MPGTARSVSDTLAGTFRDLETRLGRLERQSLYVVSDPSGNMRVELGLLANGDYGVAVHDILGNSNEINPTVAAEVATIETTTSTAYTALTTAGPSVQVLIGASGRALVIGSCGMTAGSTDNCAVGVFVDGSLTTDAFMVGNPAFSVVNLGTFAAIEVVTGIAPGEHSFEYQYKTFAGQTAHFGSRTLAVQPL